MRIAIGGFLHESHSFAPRATTYHDFVAPGGFPPLCHGAALVEALRDASVPAAGAISVVEAEQATIVPLAWAFANPAAPVQDEAFERIAALNCALLSMALDEGPLDGVYLDLHGAAMVESFPDAEGELLRRVRAIVGAEMPLTISLDPHANLTEANGQPHGRGCAVSNLSSRGHERCWRTCGHIAVRADQARPTLGESVSASGLLDSAWRPVHVDVANGRRDGGAGNHGGTLRCCRTGILLRVSICGLCGMWPCTGGLRECT